MASIKKITGTLKTLGESSTIKSETTYSYIQIDDTTISKAVIFRGLNGELKDSLGKEVTLHFQKNTIFAITNQNGKTFYTQESTLAALIVLTILVVISIPLCFVIVGIPLLIYSAWGLIKLLQARSAIKQLSRLPNAVEVYIV